MKYTKREVLTKLRLSSDEQLAAYFNIKRQAVNKWANDEPIPLQRRLQLHQRHPRKFPIPQV